MSLLYKNTSAVSEAIFKEQRQLRKERLLASLCRLKLCNLLLMKEFQGLIARMDIF